MASKGDMKAHQATYRTIMAMFKYGGVACLIVAFFVMWLIS